MMACPTAIWLPKPATILFPKITTCASRIVVMEQKFDLVAMSTPSALISKLWNYCSILRDDGLSYGDELEIHYRHTLEELGKRSGMLGVIFRKAQNKIQDPANRLDRIARKT
jgi:hypothetical protein